MFEYKFTDGEDVKTSASELRDKIKDIDKKYSVSLDYDVTKDDKTLNLGRLEYKKPDEDTLKAQAENSLRSYADVETKKINKNYDQGIQKLKDQETLLEKNNNMTISQLENSGETMKENAKSSMIKRGLARSSILDSSMKEIESGVASAIKSQRDSYQSSLDKINLEKELLQNEKESALESFNIAYAVKLTEKINKLQEDASKKEKEILDFNNKIEKEEQDFILSQQKFNITQENQELKRNDFILDYIDEYGTVGLKRLVESEKLQAAKDSLKGLNKQQALLEIETGEYRDILGDSVYKSLLNYVNGLQ